MIWLKNRKGFTLVELIVVIAITGIIITAAFSFLLSNQSSYFAIKARIEAQTEARAAMENVITNIRRAGQTQLSKISGGNELSLMIPDNNGIYNDYKYNIEYNSETDLYNLILTRGTSKYLITSNINSSDGFAVNKSEDNVISVKITTRAKKYNQSSVFELENSHKIKIDF